MNLRTFAIAAALLTMLGALGCRRSRAPSAAAAPPPAPARPLAPEPWVRGAPATWPQLVLTNQAQFAGHSGLDGASAFLLATADGRTLLATARHLIGPNGGVEPAARTWPRSCRSS